MLGHDGLVIEVGESGAFDAWFEARREELDSVPVRLFAAGPGGVVEIPTRGGLGWLLVELDDCLLRHIELGNRGNLLLSMGGTLLGQGGAAR